MDSFDYISNLLSTVMGFLWEVNDFFDSPDWGYWRFILEIIAGVFSVLCVVGVIIVWIKSRRYHQKIVYRNLHPTKEGFEKAMNKFAKESWIKIIERTKGGKESDLILSVIEADNLVDEVLKRIGYLGTNMSERLAHLTVNNLKSIEKLWEVHKVRNQIVHNSNYKISVSEAKRILDIYQKVLEELEAI